MDMSVDIKNLAIALNKTQAIMKDAIKDTENDFFKSKYADLASVWLACREALTVNGLSVIQMPSNVDNKITLTTMLLHTSGEWMRESISIAPSKLDAQAAGSVISYLRRYSLAAFLGVAQIDDDAEESMGRNDKSGYTKHAPPVSKVVPAPVKEKQTTQLGTSKFITLLQEAQNHAWDIEKHVKPFMMACYGKALSKDLTSVEIDDFIQIVIKTNPDKALEGIQRGK